MVELPSGTVTFLFTDIEGSTRLLTEHRERYGELLAEHHRLLREIFSEAGGQEIDTQGDAFFVAFRRAGDAVTAGVAAQRALAEHDWPAGARVVVRMGLHTGEPSVQPDRYVGLGVHRGARVMAAAHGGQVLLSNATRELVADELPPGVELRDLGEYRLKDFERPERLFQLVVPGLRNDFPPLRVASTAPPRRRRRRLLLAAIVLALALATAAAVILSRAGEGTAEAATISANSVGRLDPGSGEVQQQIEVERSPTSVAIGADAVWVTNANDASVSRVDPETGSVRQTIAVGSSPSGIAVGGGSVWVANSDDGTVSRIDPATNTVVQKIDVGNGPAAVAFGLGKVWVTNSADRTVSGVDPVSGDADDPVKTDAVGRGVAVGAGSVWVTDESSRAVVRIDPRSGTVTDTISVGNGPTGIAFGAGAVWVANSLDGTLSRIDPATSSVTAIRVGGSPAAVAVGGGAVWVSLEFDQRVVKIDPAGVEPRIVESLPVGNRPKGIAVGEDGVWVAVQASGQGHRGGRLVVVRETIGSYDPAASQVAVDVTTLVYDGLTAARRTGGAEGTQLVPDLAETLPVPTDGGKTYTFRLRPGIRYSDGSPVRPEDFRRGLERAFALGELPAGDWKIVGAESCSPQACDLSRGVVTGADTVTIRLDEPNPRLPLLLIAVSPAPPGTPLTEVVDGSIPGTGPYRIESVVPDREVRIVRNPHFRVWSPAARPDGYPDEIVWRLGVPGAKAVDAVVRGDADVSTDVPPDRLPELKARHAGQLHFAYTAATLLFFMNVNTPPFDDLRVRQAVNLAVDRAKMAELHGGADLATPTCQLVPPTLPGYVPYCPYTAGVDSSGAWKAPDLVRAKRLVAASGTRGRRVVVWSTPFFDAEARYTVSLLRELGYRARLKSIPDIGAYFAKLSEARPQSGFGGWLGLQLPSDVFQTLDCEFSNNWARFCDRGIDRRVRELVRVQFTDPARAARLAARIERDLVDVAPWVPYVTPRFADFLSQRVGNYQSNPYNGILLDQLWVR